MEGSYKFFIFGLILIFILGGVYFIFFFTGSSGAVNFDFGNNSLGGECLGNFYLEEGECISKVYVEGKEVSFDYYFEEEMRSIDLVLYSEVYDYLLELPREIYYSGGEIPQRKDFKLMKLDDEKQREALSPLLFEIRNAAPGNFVDQARIAISLVQNIPYAEPNESVVLNGQSLRVSRYPYQVLYEGEGSCEGKSELLSFLLRELGYGVSLFYYGPENHESVGIKCFDEKSSYESGYCFVETTAPSIIGDYSGDYPGTGRLLSMPEVIFISEGISLPEDLLEYGDSKLYSKIRSKDKLNYFDKWMLGELEERYFGLF